MSAWGNIGLVVAFSAVLLRAESASTQPIENIAAVHALLKSKSAEDRWRGVNMLAEAKSPEAAGLLISELDDDVYSGNPSTGWDVISVRAIQLLGQLRDAAAVEALIHIVQRGPQSSKSESNGVWDNTPSAVQSLGLIGDQRAVPVIVSTLSTHVQKQTQAALKPDFHSRSDPLIQDAAKALGQLGDARALPPLMKIASATYSHLGGPVNAPPQTVVAFTFNGDEIKTAFEALAKLPGADVTKVLNDYLKQPPRVTESNVNAIRWATEALSQQRVRANAPPSTLP